MSSAPHDVLVVGAGPAGLFAATIAAQRGRRVLLLEKNQKPGLKILISGGGRCNLTTTKSGADLEAQYGPSRGRWLRHALRAFPPAALCDLIRAEGVALQEEDLDKIFPVSRRAADVLDALLALAARAGVEVRTAAPMLGVTWSADGFVVDTPQGPVRAPRLVLATGGLSYPKTGATGDGYPVLRAAGHGLVPLVPALAPLAVDLPWVHALAGIVLKDAVLTLRARDGGVLVRRQRPTLFTHKGLSGPGPMDVSGFVEEVGGGCRLELDLVPGVSAEALEAELVRAAQRDGSGAVHHVLPATLPERMRRTLTAEVGSLASLTRPARRQLVRDLKTLAIPVDRSLGFAHAEVTRGGVPLDEIDPRTMESRRVPGLFVCGELLDVDGPIGGFNFQAAFATARLAGLAV